MHCVAERLAYLEDLDCMPVDDVEYIRTLSLDVQC